MRRKTNFLALLIVLAISLQNLICLDAVADTIYVDDNAPLGGDGLSWPTAYKHLQDGLSVAEYGDVIWVAEGTYYPTTKVGGTGERHKTFQMKNGVAIYGGFPDIGNPNMAERDPNQHETILSGDLAGNDIINPNKTENSYHVVISSGTDPNTILDGFTITGGNANHLIQLYFYYGGGMYNWDSNLTVTNCIFTGSSARFGGGMSNLYGSSPTVINCTFSGNSANWGGGGMNNENSNPTVINCVFTGNSAVSGGGGMGNYKSDSIVKGCTFTGNSAADNGGGMYNTLSSPTVTGCIFSGNLADKDGGGMYNYFYNYFSRPIVSSCTFSGNSANRSGGGMYNSNYSSPTVTNCVFTGNVADKRGGGMHIYRLDSPTVTNCTFSGNSADYGGGLYIFYNSSPTVTNCILYGNTSSLGGNEIALGNPSYSYPSKIDVDHCNVQGGQAGIFDDGSGNTINWGAGNIDADPLFVDADGADNAPGTEDDNLRLTAGSPCIDAGDNSVVDANSTDLDGNSRILDGDGDGEAIVDMGAYEFLAPIEVWMKFTPQALNPGSQGKWVKAHLVLPEGFAVEDVDADTPAEIEQLGIESEYMNVFINEDGLVEIEAAFRRGDFCGGVDFGPAEVTVAGRLTSGQYFYGTDTIKIVSNKLGYVADLASYWLQAGCGPADWCGGLDVDRDSVVDWRDFAMSDGCCIEIIRN